MFIKWKCQTFKKKGKLYDKKNPFQLVSSIKKESVEYVEQIEENASNIKVNVCTLKSNEITMNLNWIMSV